MVVQLDQTLYENDHFIEVLVAGALSSSPFFFLLPVHSTPEATCNVRDQDSCSDDSCSLLRAQWQQENGDARTSWAFDAFEVTRVVRDVRPFEVRAPHNMDCPPTRWP